MSAKEKAKELYCKYTDALNIRDLQTTANPFAKQCALICIDEIIDALVEYDDRNNTYELQNMDRDFNYWGDVKSELQSF
jgi:hypothetical protein